MIFKYKGLIAAALMCAGSAAFAGGDDDCSIGCGSTSGQNMLKVNGAAVISGNVGSIFDSTYGSNEVHKEGETKVDIFSELGGFCDNGDCTDSKLRITLRAEEEGWAKTTAGTKHSGQDSGLSNSGQFTSGVAAGIQFDDLTTEVKSSGAAAFANAAAAKATGKHVQTDIFSHGSGGTKSTVQTDGDACPTCADFGGGSKTWAKSGLSLNSTASGGKAGQVVGIVNMGESQSATHVGNMFKQTANN